MFGRFLHHQTVEEKEIRTVEPQKLKVVVVSFEDNCTENSGYKLFNELSKSAYFDVQYFDFKEPKEFLNLQQGSFFDLYDTGNLILKKTQAEVLVWGIRKNSKIRLNFQNNRHYRQPKLPFFSLLNAMYLPLTYFQEETFPSEALLFVEGAVLAAGGNIENLRTVVAQIGRTSPPKGLTEEYMPYVMSMLTAVYTQARAENLNEDDVNLILNFLRRSRQLSQPEKDNPLWGNFYMQAGQLFMLQANSDEVNKFTNLRKSIESFRYARKFFNRYNFPYDFGMLTYFLSRQYFEFWKQTDDIQALRDAVFYLRESEKIFTQVGFPLFWAEIQKDLGYYLSLLGSFGKNDEILMLAMDNYKNCQKVFSKDADPEKWAQCEESVGNILYTIGKIHGNEEYLTKSAEAFSAAGEIYEDLKQTGALRQMRICQTKSEEQIMRLKEK